MNSLQQPYVPFNTMTHRTLIIGNKAYSSWSLRPWLAMRQAQIPFTEYRIPLYTADAPQRIRQFSPAGKVPVLVDGDRTVWDSLAILEYLMEEFPACHWLPADPVARAVARSISAEMHAGFAPLRQQMPMNCRAHYPGRGMTPEVQADIERITAIWRDCRQEFGADGPFLFGAFTIADAMYAPVVSRFRTYGVELDALCSAYCEAIEALPAMQAWVHEARLEPEVIAAYEQTAATDGK